MVGRVAYFQKGCFYMIEDFSLLYGVLNKANFLSDWLMDCMVFNAIFINDTDIWQRPVYLSILSLSFSLLVLRIPFFPSKNALAFN